MRNRLFIALLFSSVGLSAGCSGLNTLQRAEYQVMKDKGMAVEEKNPNVAAALGLLPGCGSFYTRQLTLGVVDLLFWPASILWDPFVGYSGAEVINYDVSRAYAKKHKEKELADLEHLKEDNRITQAEFIDRRRSIDSKYNFD